MQFPRALGARHSPQCCSSGPFPLPHSARSQQPAGDSTASLSPSCSCHRGSALADLKAQQNLGKGSGEAQRLWDFWPGKCFLSP